MAEEYVEGWAEASARMYTDRVDAVVRSLRDLADAVERRREPKVSIRTMRPDFLQAAGEILHEVHWGLANAALDTVVRVARDAQQAQDAKPEEAPA